MAISVMNWVLEDAPDLPPHCFSVLMALASKAREDGTAAYPGQEWLAERSRKSDRSVRNDLGALEQLGLIRRGDQSIVTHLPADERPIVWDLAVERMRDRKSTSGRKPTAARKPGSGGERKPASAYTSSHTSTTKHPSDAAADERMHTQDTLDGGPPPESSPTVNQRAKRITDAYAASVPMCKWQAVNPIVIRAINANKWTDTQIRDAILRLAASRMTVTVNALGNELEPPDNVRQLAASRNSYTPYQNPADQSEYDKDYSSS